MSENLRMDAYYYGFDKTGYIEVDRILSAVAVAGKAYHHTEGWHEQASEDGEESYVDKIQKAALEASSRLSHLSAVNEKLVEVLEKTSLVIRRVLDARPGGTWFDDLDAYDDGRSLEWHLKQCLKLADEMGEKP